MSLSADAAREAVPAPATRHSLLVGLGEVASMLGVDRGTAGRWAEAGILPSPKIRNGKRAFWSRAAVVAWASSAG